MMNGNLLSIFNLDNIRFYQNACLNYVNRRQVCQDCLMLCPSHAISLKDDLPVINFNKCSECGLCSAVCPTFALDNSRYPYSDIHNQLNKHSLASISCEKDQLHTKGIKLPCLLALDLPLLLTLNKNHSTLNLYIGGCSSCLRAPLSSIRSHLANLQSDLLAMSSELEIKLTNEAYVETQAEAVSGLTRRELLQSFSLKKFKEFEFIKENEEALHEKDKLHLKERVLYKRKIVAQHLVSNKALEYSKKLAEHYQVEVAATCNGCNICAAICPTNALYWQETDRVASLYFDTELCIGCERCTLCSMEAIKIQTLNYDEEKKINQVLLASFKLNCCQDCNELFRSDKEVDLCSICEKKQNRESYFTNF